MRIPNRATIIKTYSIFHKYNYVKLLLSIKLYFKYPTLIFLNYKNRLSTGTEEMWAEKSGRNDANEYLSIEAFKNYI